MIASPASSEAESLEMKDDEPTIKIASYYSLAADKEEQHEEQEQHIEPNAFLPSVQQPPRPRTVNPRQSLEMKSNISKDLLDKLVENRNYCKLCPLKAKQDVFKTKGALKFHLRIKHFRELTKEVEQENFDTMSESEILVLPRSRKLSQPSSEPPRSPPGLIRTPSRSVYPLRTQEQKQHSEIPSSEEPSSKVECHDLLVSDDDENWTLQMDDDDDEVIIEGETKITDFIRESFKKEEQIESKSKNKMESTESKSSSHLPIKPIPAKPLQRLPCTDLKSSNEPLAKQPEKQKSPEIPPKTVLQTTLTTSTVEDKDNPELEAKPKKKRGKKGKKKKVVENVGYYDDLQIIKELSPKKKTFPGKVFGGQSSSFKSNAAEYVYQQLLETYGGRPKDKEESKAPFNITICPICKQTFWKSDEYSEHMKTEHLENKDKEQSVTKEKEPQKLSKGEASMPYFFVKVKIPPHKMRMYKRWTIPPKMEYNYSSWDDIPLMDNITKASISWASPKSTPFTEPTRVIEVSPVVPDKQPVKPPSEPKDQVQPSEPKDQLPQKPKEIVTINLDDISQVPSDVPREPNRTPSGSSGLKMVPIQSLTNPTKPENNHKELTTKAQLPNNGEQLKIPVIDQTEAEMARMLTELEKAKPSNTDTYNKVLNAQLSRPAMNHSREADIVRILSEMNGMKPSELLRILIEQQKQAKESNSTPNITELKAHLKRPVVNQAEGKMIRMLAEIGYSKIAAQRAHLLVPKSQAGPRFDHRQIVIPKTAVESHRMPPPLQVGPRLNDLNIPRPTAHSVRQLNNPPKQVHQNAPQIRPKPIRPMMNQIRLPQGIPKGRHQTPIASKPEEPKRISPRPSTSPRPPLPNGTTLTPTLSNVPNSMSGHVVRPHARLGVPISHVNGVNNPPPRVKPTILPVNGIPINILSTAPRPTHVPMYTPELFYRPIRQGQVGKPAAAQTTTVPSSTSTKPSKPTIPVEQPKMPDLLPLKSMISSSPPVSVSSSSSSSSTKTKSKLRLVRPWEQRKREEGYKDIEVVNVDEDYDEPEEAEEQQDTEQEYVPLKKRRLIMYELDCNYSHIKFGNSL